ncbi:NUMB phenylalanine-rich region [Ancylostoma duodenale]|uniref:NUMB phenylalanine-rich region n=1 Tax=Ancylostoma duodenale TaxID=51022 RepID=A0A0C2H9B6_9BILA|nr:NUMB phenylalanine-rich region [Ancylostoma duodenale]
MDVPWISCHKGIGMGERLSHAVGCAFSICLERKKKRDEENVQSLEKALNPNWEEKESRSCCCTPPNEPGLSIFPETNTDQRKITGAATLYPTPILDFMNIWHLQDPQSAIVNTAPLSAAQQPSSSIAKPRPTPNPALFQRQGSLRAPESSSAAQFRRNYSLRTNAQSLDGFPVKSTFGKQSLHNEPIYEGEEENNLQAAASFASSPLSLANTTMPSRPTTSTYTAPPAVTPSTDLFDLIGLGPTTSTSASNEVVSYGVSKDQAVVPQPQWMASSTSTPTAALPSSTSLTNGMNAATATSQINVNTNWAAAGSSSQPSSRSKADEWLEDAFRTALTVNSPPLPMSVWWFSFIFAAIVEVHLFGLFGMMSPVTDMPAVSSTGIQSWQSKS